MLVWLLFGDVGIGGQASQHALIGTFAETEPHRWIALGFTHHRMAANHLVDLVHQQLALDQHVVQIRLLSYTFLCLNHNSEVESQYRIIISASKL